MSDWHYPPFPCCGGLAFHRGGPTCDAYRGGAPAMLLEQSPPEPDWQQLAARLAEALAAIDTPRVTRTVQSARRRAQIALADYAAATKTDQTPVT